MTKGQDDFRGENRHAIPRIMYTYSVSTERSLR